MFLANIDFDRVIHSIKTALACLIGFALTKVVTFQTDQWVIVTILVVMCAQINVGSMIQKSYHRFLGTLTGSILAVICMELFGHEYIAVASMVAFSGFIFSFIATSEKTYSDAGTLAAVTTTIILIAPHPTLTSAAERFLEISLGIMIAALVSQFVFPIHARFLLRRTQAKTIKQLQDYFELTILTAPTPKNIEAYRELDEAIVKSLTAQRNLAKFSRREYFGDSFNSESFADLLRCEKEIFRSIVCMHFSYDLMPSGRKTLTNLQAVTDFHKDICAAFKKISTCIDSNTAQETITIPTLQPIKEAILAIKKINTEDDSIYLDGFLFCAELLIIHLAEIAVLLRNT